MRSALPPSAVLDHVNYRYPEASEAALMDESWQIEPSCFALVIGPSGGGKSTLLRCLNGLVPHFSGGTFGGAVHVGGRDTRAFGPRDFSQQVGFVFQDPEAQLVTDRVDNEIAFGLEQHGVNRITMRKRVEEALDYLGIEALRDRRPQELSGGERQRVAIAAALATHPAMIVLDEPTSQLDPWAAEDVLTVLTRLNEDFGMTVVVAEHRLERLMSRADVVRFMPGNGQPSTLGTPVEMALTMDTLPLPPVTRLGRALGYTDPPLTVKQARTRFTPMSRPAPTPTTATAGDVVSALEQVTIQLGTNTIFRDFDLQVREGELVAIMGRNGVGKTTLLRAMAGLQPVTKGSVVTCNINLGTQSPEALAGKVGYVPQHASSLFFRERLDAEIAFTAKARGVTLDLDAVLARFSLEGKGATHPLDLSGESANALPWPP